MGSRRKRTRRGKTRKWRTLPPGVRGVSMERPAPFVPSSPSRLPPPTSLLPLPVPLSVPLARVARLPHGENTQSMIIMHLSASAALPPRRGLTSSIHAPATAMSYDSTLLRALAAGSPGQGAAHFSQTPPLATQFAPGVRDPPWGLWLSLSASRGFQAGSGGRPPAAKIAQGGPRRSKTIPGRPPGATICPSGAPKRSQKRPQSAQNAVFRLSGVLTLFCFGWLRERFRGPLDGPRRRAQDCPRTPH